ncbi:T9SS type A sorting domain-containing protein [Neolewinella litorea]|uniref:T9SS type A sorting domain-containing protein n=1 Tax=Neolewinella litorea TaxID=2562452 RepID=A0A4S4NJL2_9BACT|nr:T9SS type A sorting domain-containing protein [Neolewinella litorea]THH39972.1 T9SS type A sorting domain-containing protein [Neolewinella litorea]
MNYNLFWSTLLLTVLSLQLNGQAAVTVRTDAVLNDVTDLPLGLNLNTLTDAQGNRPADAEPLAAAINRTGVRYLRFPGGEKSDIYAWAAPPYNDPSTSYLLRQSERDWPSNDPDFWDLSAGKWANNNYNFDQFMADCRATGAEPVVVVAFDGMYLPANNGGTSLTREQALEMAVAWVRYANVTKGYNVKYWELGNETWNGTTYAGRHPGFSTYGRDAAEFARAMKAVDPSILIGINGATFSDFDLALKECAAEVDFLDVHTYPAYGFTSYDQYISNQLNPNSIVNVAQQAIDAVPDAAVRDKLFIVMTETSATGYQLSSEWDAGNNLGQALANFDILMQMIQDSRVRFTQFWNSRWIRPDTGNSHPYDLFTATNELNASGKMIALMTEELLDDMVATTSDGVVRTFATANRSRDQLTVFLLNKDKVATTTDLRVEGFASASSAERTIFTGDHPASSIVELTDAPDAAVQGDQLTLTLPPTSLTVLRFNAGTPTSSNTASSDFWLEAECGTVGSRWSTKTSPDASEGKYVVGPNERSMSEAPADLDANRVRFSISNATAGNYKLFARINAPSNLEDSYYVRVNGGSWYKWYSRILHGRGYRWNQLPIGLSLRAGENTIDFAFREPNTQLDKLYLTLEGALPGGLGADAENCGTTESTGSSNPGTSNGAAEAECADDSGDWNRQSSSAAAGGSYMVFTGDRNMEVPTTTNTSQELRYNLATSEAGAYHLFMRVDAPDPSRNSVWVKVDDQPWMKFWRETNGDQLLTNGFEWRRVNHDGVARTLQLDAGAHTIRVANREPGTGVDKLVLTRTNTAPDGFGPDDADCAAASAQSTMAAASTQETLTMAPLTEATVSLYPNPAVNHLTLELTSGYSGAVDLTVFDLNGRRVRHRVLQKDGEFLTAKLALRSLPAGMYRLRVVEGTHSTTASFIRR